MHNGHMLWQTKLDPSTRGFPVYPPCTSLWRCWLHHTLPPPNSLSTRPRINTESPAKRCFNICASLNNIRSNRLSVRDAGTKDTMVLRLGHSVLQRVLLSSLPRREVTSLLTGRTIVLVVQQIKQTSASQMVHSKGYRRCFIDKRPRKRRNQKKACSMRTKLLCAIRFFAIKVARKSIRPQATKSNKFTGVW